MATERRSKRRLVALLCFRGEGVEHGIAQACHDVRLVEEQLVGRPVARVEDFHSDQLARGRPCRRGLFAGSTFVGQ